MTNDDTPVTCSYCDHAPLWRWFAFPDSPDSDRPLRYRDACHSDDHTNRAVAVANHDRQLVEDATHAALAAHTGLCYDCRAVYGTTWRAAPETCPRCDGPLDPLPESESETHD